MTAAKKPGPEPAETETSEAQEISASATPSAATETPAQTTDNWQQKYQEVYDQYVRLAADFDNYRKRVQQDQEAARKYGAEATMHELIPVLDNLERATGSLSENSDPKMLYQSFRLVHNQLMESLATLGLKKVETVGKPFDPMFHEAVSQVATADHPEDTVVSEMQSGYILKDRLLRPAMVAVAVAVAVLPATTENTDAAASDDNPFSKTASGGQYTPGKEAP